ncbi:class II lanthipeptide, LchA2/BrtA2 family [Paenibacillus sp. PCH8]|uniref:class II lanthipeptide, LchA2/BrtA2 family n=1 Tax=Paenibacillus sp. PCH8 TaxID=2066524 RepID=UPI0011B021A2|nr:class II lanthipeptide, LchA2/BrtA2 family [Paenibacillus sp. PCH8]
MTKREIRKEILENNTFICEKEVSELQDRVGGAIPPITTSSWICGLVTMAVCPSTACTGDC